jgi:5-oxoprolinase (ATP-hydrolysing)
MNSHKFYIDTGGTFTDCIGVFPDGSVHYQKVLSSGKLRAIIKNWHDLSSFEIRHSWNIDKDIFKSYKLNFIEKPGVLHSIQSFDPHTNIIQLDCEIGEQDFIEFSGIEISAFEEAPVLGIRMLTQTALNQEFPSMTVRLGSTKGTNALLENKGDKTALFITKGFKDLLQIGNQSRPDIFSKHIHKSPSLAEKIIEVDERISTEGEILKPLEKNKIEKIIRELKNEGIKSLSIALLNSVQNPFHENEIKLICKNQGFNYISVATELSVLIKLLERTETTVVNAYLSPVIHHYLSSISKTLGKIDLKVMTSSGGLINSLNYFPKDSLLSGPAGGVVGAAISGQESGFKKLISFDMGGTSTDASRYDNGFDYVYDLQVGHAKIMSPSLAIETVAAGGGSICGYDGYKLFVGPESAGASPGPACYGAGGPLTITDINLLANRLLPDNFSIPVYPSKAEEKLSQLIDEIESKTSKRPEADDLIYGFLKIANEIMAGAIRKISLGKGYDPKDYAMVSFGGAGGLHCCDIASLLGIKNIIVPREAGLLSAFGIGNAKIERFATRQILQSLDSSLNEIEKIVTELQIKAKADLLDDGVNKDQVETREVLLYLRFFGQDSSIEIPWQSEVDIKHLFKEKYLHLYGHWVERDIELEAIRVVVSERGSKNPKQSAKIKYYIPGYDLISKDIPVFRFSSLKTGAKIQGPAIILDDYSTLYIPENWNYILENTTGLLKFNPGKSKNINDNPEAELELFTNRFMSVAENMGAMLQRTALSVNIKERLDFSCALLDENGYLVANAPHIPVHLGGLGVCVRTILKKFNFKPGDTIVTNHPGYGGSHLPDVTVITPVFAEDDLLAFVVNRAHHSELGGISPGSMPPAAKNLAEEGVVISPFYLVKENEVNWAGMRSIFENAPYPSRSIEENMADLNAALAANKKGSEEVLQLVKNFGSKKLRHYFKELRKYASSRITDTLKKFPDGSYSAVELLDDGSRLQLNAEINNGSCHFDFTGSSEVHPSNMNATQAIVNSVVIYFLRLLLDENIPLNDGLLQPVKITIPKGILNPDFPENPFECPAVVGGNVEISQRLTDTLIKAFRLMAASQGTMNNVLFGNDKFGYYETLAGGTGAGKGFCGMDATHHHMTNTRITDPEIIEKRFPLRLNRFEIRRGSGGIGKWKGGDGLVREYEFLENVNLSILSQRRKSQPFGMDGGKPGKTGKQYLEKKNGDIIEINGIDNVNLNAGDKFIVKTPGGGGFSNI